MKHFLSILLLPVLAVSGFAQEQFMAKAVFSVEKGDTFIGWIIAATETEVRYKVRDNAADFTDAKIKDFTTIYLMLPDEYGAAMDFYEAGKYQEALEAFKKYKEVSKPIAKFANNYHTLAAFYELECLRHIGDYEGLATALQSFIKKPLVRDEQLRQLDLYVMWDALKAKDWPRLVLVASEMDEVDLPEFQRVQVAYCKGLGLQNTARHREALIQYGIVMSVDAGGSRQLAESAALSSLQIYHEDAEVQLAMKNWKTEDENKVSVGYARLQEARKLAKIYEKLIKSDTALPADYAKFLKFDATPK